MTEIDPRLGANICEHCGESQIAGGVQAPMLHWGAKSYHLNHLPHDLEAYHRGRHGKAIDAAKSGLRGDELRLVIHREAAEVAAAEARHLEAAGEPHAEAIANARAQVDAHNVLVNKLVGAK